MAAQSGRDILLLKNSTAFAGLQDCTVAVNSEPVDITNKNDSGYRTLASFAGVGTIDLSGSGVFIDDTIRDVAFAAVGTTKLLTDITVDFGDGATISGNFYLNSYSAGGAHDGAETYEVSLQSSGTWTYTASV